MKESELRDIEQSEILTEPTENSQVNLLPIQEASQTAPSGRRQALLNIRRQLTNEEPNIKSR